MKGPRAEYLVAVAGRLYCLDADGEQDAGRRIFAFLGGRGKVGPDEGTTLVSFDATGAPMQNVLPPLTAFRLAPVKAKAHGRKPRAAALQSPKNRHTPPPAQAEDLATFAGRVRATALELESRDSRPQWQRGKYFISDVFEARKDWGLGFAAFKQRLLEARRATRLTLSRGDLIASLPADKVKASLVEDGDRQFHYVEIINWPLPVDPAAAAEVILRIARQPGTQFDRTHAYISRVWDGLQGEGFTNDLPELKALLLKLNRARLLTLSRGDFVEAMDAKELRRSEISYHSAHFHFVRL